MNISSEIVNRLKSWRAKNSLSQGDAAAILGVTRSYLNQVENGRPPGKALVEKLDAIDRPEKVNIAGEPNRLESEQRPASSPDLVQILARQNEIQAAQTAILERMLSAIERLERKDREPPQGKDQRRVS